MKPSWLVGLALLMPATVRADAECSLKGVKAIRRKADALMKHKQYAAAAKVLEAGACFVYGDQAPGLQVQIGWLVSDQSFAYYKAGDPDSCYSRAEGQLTPKSGSIESYLDANANLQPVLDALTHNSAVCYAAIEKARGNFIEAKACGEDGYTIPSEVLPAGLKSQCISFGGSTEDSEGLHSCGAVELASTPANGKVSTTTLHVDGANLTDGSICCNRTFVGFQKRGASWAMLVKTWGRNCDGGTADTAEDEVYKLVGKALSSEGSVRVGYH